MFYVCSGTRSDVVYNIPNVESRGLQNEMIHLRSHIGPFMKDVNDFHEKKPYDICTGVIGSNVLG